MEVSYKEAFRIYRNIQKEKEDRKRVVIKEEIVCGMKIRRTELIDDTDPAASQSRERRGFPMSRSRESLGKLD